MAISALTDIAGCVSWWDPRRDSAHADGDAVIPINYGSGAAFAQATSGMRPLYKVGILGSGAMPCYRFDGANDFVTAAQSGDETTTVFFVAKKRSAVGFTSQDAFSFETGAGSFHVGCNANYGTGWIWYPNDGFAVSDIGGTPTTTGIVGIRVNSDSSLDTWVDGAFSTNLDPANDIGSWTSVGLGAKFDGSEPGDFDLGVGAVWDTALSSPQVTDVLAYMTGWLAGSIGGVNARGRAFPRGLTRGLA